MEKQLILHYLSVSVVLVIQHATRMRLIILSSVACLTVSYFFTLTHRPREFRKKYVWNIKRWFSLKLFSEIFIILRITQRDIVIKVKTSSRKVDVILVVF